MGWLKKLYRGVDRAAGGFLPGAHKPEDVTWRDAVGTIGDAAKAAAPVVAFIPGVGPIAAAGLGAAGGLAGQLNDEDGFKGWLGDTVKGGVWGGAGGMAASSLAGQGTGAMGSFLGLGGGAGGAGAAGGGAGAAVPAAEAATAGAGGGGGFLSGIGNWGGVGGALKDVGGWVKDNPDLALAIGTGLYGAHEGYRANQQSDRALRMAEDEWNSRAPLREAGMAGLMAPIPERQDLTDIFADPGNPYHRAIPRPALPPGPPPKPAGFRKRVV